MNQKKTENKRDIKIIHFDPDQFNQLKQLAKKTGFNVSDLIRAGLSELNKKSLDPSNYKKPSKIKYTFEFLDKDRQLLNQIQSKTDLNQTKIIHEAIKLLLVKAL